MLRALVEFDDGSEKELKILVDTGAEANLIRKGLVDSLLIFSAKKYCEFHHCEWATVEWWGKMCKYAHGIQTGHQWSAIFPVEMVFG